MNVDVGLLDKVDIGSALGAELVSSRRALPPDSVFPALAEQQVEASRWIRDWLAGGVEPSQEETVGVNKGRHGLRPVAVWDIPSRVAYRALTQRLAPQLPVLVRNRSAWLEFQRAPLQRKGRYVVAADIAACYQYVDHGLLAGELLIQTGDHQVVEAIGTLLRETSGRTYGLPQQSYASDVLAEAFLARLERALVRRGLDVDRYNDDFRLACATWSEVVRSIEVLEEEARLVGLTLNDLKTITWSRGKYEAHLDDVDTLRRELAEEAELDLAAFDADDYGDATMEVSGDIVDRMSAVLLLERWRRVAGGMNIPARRRAEHRAIVELLPNALGTLGTQRESSPEILGHCMQLLRLERTLTPAVGRYLSTREGGAQVVEAFDRLLGSRSFLNGWQTWWLQQPVAWREEYAVGAGSARRLKWARTAMTSAEHTPVLRAEAARTLARHKQISIDEMLKVYDRASNVVRPIVVAGLALLKPSKGIRNAVTGDSRLNAWVYEWAARDA